MAAVPEGAIDSNVAGLRREKLQNFGDHDRAVGAGGSFAGGDDFGNGVCMERGIMLLIFLLETAWVFATVPHPAFVRRRSRSRGCGFFGHGGRLPEKDETGEEDSDRGLVF